MEADIETAMIRPLRRRGTAKTCCPSEVPRLELAGQLGDAWRDQVSV